MRKIVLALIKIYQSIPKRPTCRFIPSCSQYTSEAIEQYGIIAGMYLSAKRLIRCYPLSRGGYDRVLE